MLVDELEQALDVEFSERDEDTVGGVMLSELRASPSEGDEVTLPPLTLRVVEVDENRIKRVRVTVNVPAPAET
jgi:CBS domain containing-hemolysin-like protein